jgi:hypothetical protein
MQDNEKYPPNWKHCLIHLNPDTGEMHSDGDHSVREWIQDKIRAAEVSGSATVNFPQQGQPEKTADTVVGDL